MQNLSLLVLTVAGLIVISGCVQQAEAPVHQNTTNESTKLPTDKVSCESRGGKWDARFSGEFCNFPASDAGKECSNSDECDGDCISELSEEDSVKVQGGEPVFTKGKCSAWKTNVGCHAFVEGGRVDRILCID